jgi:hypothetical protein
MRQKNRLLTEDTGKTCSLGLLLPELTEPWRRPQRHEEKETPRPGKMNRGKMLRSSTSHIESEQHKTRCKNTFSLKNNKITTDPRRSPLSLPYLIIGMEI